MTYEQIYTPPAGELVENITTIRRWAIQFTGDNWSDVGEFLRYFRVNWCMHLCGGTAENPDRLEVEDEDGLMHQVRLGEWINIDDSEARYVGVFSDRYHTSHYIPAQR